MWSGPKAARLVIIVVGGDRTADSGKPFGWSLKGCRPQLQHQPRGAWSASTPKGNPSFLLSVGSSRDCSTSGGLISIDTRDVGPTAGALTLQKASKIPWRGALYNAVQSTAISRWIALFTKFQSPHHPIRQTEHRQKRTIASEGLVRGPCIHCSSRLGWASNPYR